MSTIHQPTLTLEEVLRRYSGGPSTGLFTDGSARPNPGPGGWAAVLVKDNKVLQQLHGFEESTTNNRMELTALIEGIKLLDTGEEIEVYSDSELCVNTITKWAPSWERNNWRRKTGPIANLDLVQQLYALCKQRPKVRLKWIKAHNGWLWNEYADSLSTAWTRETL
ncbi:MAG: ribonuclease HI [Deltaproteobacteria bacterium]|nr:ribonuclease HI [Deltaproteobacteria bacterium]